MIRLSIDLDCVIANFKEDGQTYFEVKPIPGAKEKIKSLRKKGHYIIINTARHMKTCDGNQSLVIKRIGKMTLDWLDKYEIEYDEIYFGKPYADVYIDDNAFRFTNWDEIKSDGSSLPISKEKVKELNK